jgi:hypothetical protein
MGNVRVKGSYIHRNKRLDFTQKITRALEAMHAHDHIDDKTMEYLTPEDPKPGRFYLLPNIHKEYNPGRPIVSVNGSLIGGVRTMVKINP